MGACHGPAGSSGGRKPVRPHPTGRPPSPPSDPCRQPQSPTSRRVGCASSGSSHWTTQSVIFKSFAGVTIRTPTPSDRTQIGRCGADGTPGIERVRLRSGRTDLASGTRASDAVTYPATDGARVGGCVCHERGKRQEPDSDRHLRTPRSMARTNPRTRPMTQRPACRTLPPMAQRRLTPNRSIRPVKPAQESQSVACARASRSVVARD